MNTSVDLILARVKNGSMVILRWMAKHPFLAFVILLISWRLHGELLKVYWDWRINRMCANEQNLQVFVPERIPPDPGRIGPQGPYVPLKANFPAGSKTEYKVGDIYYMTWIRETMHEGSPRVTRHITEVVRASTGEILARAVAYGRSGGDFVVIDHHTSFGCGPTDGDLYNALFRKGG